MNQVNYLDSLYFLAMGCGEGENLMLPQHLGWRPTSLTRHTAALSRPPLLRGIIGSPGCISHASHPFSRHARVTFTCLCTLVIMHLKRAQRARYLPPGPPLQPADFVVGLLARQHHISLICKVNSVQRAPNHPSLSKRRCCKRFKRNRRRVRKNSH